MLGAYFGVLTSNGGAMTIRRIIACILLPCYLVACTTWKTQEASPEQVLAEEPGKVQVTLTDGSQLVLEDPAVSGDTLSGLYDGAPVHIPLADVWSIAVKGTDATKTGFVVLGVVLTVVAILYFVACADSDNPTYINDNCPNTSSQ